MGAGCGGGHAASRGASRGGSGLEGGRVHGGNGGGVERGRNDAADGCSVTQRGGNCGRGGLLREEDGQVALHVRWERGVPSWGLAGRKGRRDYGGKLSRVGSADEEQRGR